VIDRKTTPALYLLRALQIGLTIGELKEISIGMYQDLLIERGNDDYDYPVLANQEDIDAF